MPHSCFDIHDGIHVVDAIGQVRPDHRVAKGEDMKIVAGIAGTSKALAVNGCAFAVIVRDAPDSTVMTLRLVFPVQMSSVAERRQA